MRTPKELLGSCNSCQDMTFFMGSSLLEPPFILEPKILWERSRALPLEFMGHQQGQGPFLKSSSNSPPCCCRGVSMGVEQARLLTAKPAGHGGHGPRVTPLRSCPQRGGWWHLLGGPPALRLNVKGPAWAAQGPSRALRGQLAYSPGGETCTCHVVAPGPLAPEGAGSELGQPGWPGWLLSPCPHMSFYPALLQL